MLAQENEPEDPEDSSAVVNDEWQDFVSRFWRSMYLIYGVILFTIAWLIYNVVTSYEGDSEQIIETVLVGGALIMVGMVHAYIVYRMNTLNLQRIQHLIMHDELTQLFNLHTCKQYLADEMARAQRYSQSFTVLSVDIDGFKNVNDSLGHAKGDAVLRSVGEALQEQTRKPDLVARIGGDEFLVMMPNTGIEGSKALASRLINSISSIPVVTQSGGEGDVRIGASMGVVAFPEHGNTLEKLLYKADQALYAAKQNGGNQYVIYSGRSLQRSEQPEK